MNKPLTLKMLAALAAGLAVLYAIFVLAMNWKVAAGVLQGTHTVLQALRQAEPYVGGFMFFAVIICLIVPGFFGRGAGAVSNDDEESMHRRDHDHGPQVNPANGLPMTLGGVDVMGNAYGTDNSFNTNQH